MLPVYSQLLGHTLEWQLANEHSLKKSDLPDSPHQLSLAPWYGGSLVIPSIPYIGMLIGLFLCRSYAAISAAVNSQLQWSCGIKKTLFNPCPL